MDEKKAVEQKQMRTEILALLTDYMAESNKNNLNGGTKSLCLIQSESYI